MEFENIRLVLTTWLFTHGLKIMLIIFASLAINTFSDMFFRQLHHLRENSNTEHENKKKIQTLYSISNSISRVLIFTIALMLILDELEINIAPILAAAGVLGVAIGFGSQRLIEDVISGFLILLNNEIRVGDTVKINGLSGNVEKITLNMVILRDLSGNVHFIRNGKIDIVTNMTKEYSYYVFDISIGYNEDVERVIEVIKSIATQMQNDENLKNDILEPIEVFGLDKFDDSAVIIKARIKTIPIKQWAIGREFNLRMKKEFDRLGIEIPYPQICVHN